MKNSFHRFWANAQLFFRKIIKIWNKSLQTQAITRELWDNYGQRLNMNNNVISRLRALRSSGVKTKNCKSQNVKK